MNNLKNVCKVIFEEKFNSVIDVINNPDKKLVLISPFDGDKKLHGRISICVAKRIYGESIPEGKLKVMMYSGRTNIDTTYVSTINELRDVLETYVNVIEDIEA